MTIKELREKKGLTQSFVSKLTGIPLRTYKDYENNPSRVGNIKYNYILDKLNDYGNFDKDHGVLDLDFIKNQVKKALKPYKIEYCYLFGSYAKGNPNDSSDVNLFIYSKDISFDSSVIQNLIEKSLMKNVEISTYDLKRHTNILLRDILDYGIRII